MLQMKLFSVIGFVGISFFLMGCDVTDSGSSSVSSSSELLSSAQGSSSSSVQSSSSSVAAVASLCPAKINSSTTDILAAWNSCDSLFQTKKKNLGRVDVLKSGFYSAGNRYWMTAGIVDSSAQINDPLNYVLFTTDVSLDVDTSSQENPIDEIYQMKDSFCKRVLDTSICIQVTSAEFDTTTGLPITVRVEYNSALAVEVDGINLWKVDGAAFGYEPGII